MLALPQPQETHETKEDSMIANHDPFQDPGDVIKCMILDAMKLFIRDNAGQEPTRLSLTTAMEDLLRQHMLLEFTPEYRMLGTHHGPLRPEKFMGMTAIYDASDFVLE